MFAQVNAADCFLLDTFNAGIDAQAYLWTSVPGYSSFGKYQGNSSNDGVLVSLPFRPAWVMIKDIDNAYDDAWVIQDSTRSPNNPSTNYLVANRNLAENGGGSDLKIDLLSNGFKIRTNYGQINASHAYVYCAFAENPLSSPVTAR